MPRAKHGRYNAEQHLPDNTGQPQGSGIIVWFHAQIVARLGDKAGQAIIAESRAHGSQSRAWLCEQLTGLGHPDLVEAYAQRRRADAAAGRIREKERMICMCKGTLERNDTPPEHQAFLRKRIAKMQKYLDAHPIDSEDIP